MGTRLNKEPIAKGRYALAIDGTSQSGHIKSVTAGPAKGNVLVEGVGNDYVRLKHVGTIEIEPFQIEIAMASCRGILEWLDDSLRHKHSTRNGALSFGNNQYEEAVEYTFTDALLTELKFPTVDANSNDPPYLTVSYWPQDITLEMLPGGPPLKSEMDDGTKGWGSRNFAFRIDDSKFTAACRAVNKVDGFSIKQKVAALYTGQRRKPELHPTGIEFGDLTVWLSLNSASAFVDWHKTYIIDGQRDTSAEKTGTLMYLDHSCKEATPLLTMSFDRMGINSFSVEQVDAGKGGKIQMAKVSLHFQTVAVKLGPKRVRSPSLISYA